MDAGGSDTAEGAFDDVSDSSTDAGGDLRFKEGLAESYNE